MTEVVGKMAVVDKMAVAGISIVITVKVVTASVMVDMSDMEIIIDVVKTGTAKGAAIITSKTTNRQPRFTVIFSSSSCSIKML